MNKSISYKIVLIKNGITQRQVAQILHFSESYVSMLISGERKNEIFDKFIDFLTTKDESSEVIK